MPGVALKFVHVVFMEVIEESGFRFFEVFSKGVIVGIIGSHAVI